MLRDALVLVFRSDFKEIELGLSSVTEVQISPDLHFAHVFISGLKEDETRELVERLQQRRGRIRSLLGQRIRLRYTPELDFRYDDTAARAGRIESLLQEIKPQDDHDDQS